MNRATFVLIAACLLAGCGGTPGENASDDTSGFTAGSDENARANPSDMTSIDAALNFDGGMPADSAMPDAPVIPARAAASVDAPAEVPPTAPATPVAPPALPPATTVSNTTAE